MEICFNDRIRFMNILFAVASAWDDKESFLLIICTLSTNTLMLADKVYVTCSFYNIISYVYILVSVLNL